MSEINLYSTQNDKKGYNLFHNLRGTMQINQSLVNPHFKSVPGFGPFTTRRLSRRDPQTFSWQAYGTFHLELFLFCPFDQITTNFITKKTNTYESAGLKVYLRGSNLRGKICLTIKLIHFNFFKLRC